MGLRREAEKRGLIVGQGRSWQTLFGNQVASSIEKLEDEVIAAAAIAAVAGED